MPDFPARRGPWVLHFYRKWLAGAAKGTILPPAESGGKFYVVRILEKRPAGPMTFDQAKEEVRQALIVKKQQEILEQWYEEDAKKVRIEHL